MTESTTSMDIVHTHSITTARRENSLVRIVWRAADGSIWTILAVGLILIIVSLIPGDYAKREIDRWLPPLQAINFPLGRIIQILVRIRFMGLALSLVGLVSLLVKNSIRNYITDVILSGASMAFLSRARMISMIRRESVDVILVGLLTVHAAIIRWMFIDQPMRCDESDTYIGTSSRRLIEALSVYHSPNNHLFYTLLSHFTTKWLGVEPYAIRLPAFVAGILVIPASYIVIRSFFNRSAAVVTAALASCSAYLILYSVNGRGYSLQCLCALSALAICAYLVRSPDRLAWLLLAVVMAAGFYAIPTMLYPFAACFGWLLLMGICAPLPVARRLFIVDLGVSAALTFAMAFLLYLPVILVSGPSQLVANRFVKPLPFQTFVVVLDDRFSEFVAHSSVSFPHVMWWMLALGVLWACIKNRSIAKHRVSITLTIIGASLVILIVQRAAPFARVWQWLLPVYLGAGAAGIISLLEVIVRKPGIRAAVVAVLTISACVIADGSIMRHRTPSKFIDTDEFDDGRAVAAFLKDRGHDDDRIVVTYPGYPVVAYYLQLLDARKVKLVHDGTFNLVLIDVPLKDFNVKLEAMHQASLDPAQLQMVKGFDHCALYSISEREAK